MNQELDFTVVYVVVFLLSSAFGREPSTDITNAVQTMAKECGNREVGNEVVRCLSKPESNITTKGRSEARVIEDLNILPNCIQPLKQLVSTCGKDNYVTILEIVRAIGQNDGKLIKKFEEAMSNAKESPCSNEEEAEKITQAWQICYKEKIMANDKNLLDRFCWFATGARSCFLEIRDVASPEGCPRHVAVLSVVLDILDSTENIAEDSAAVNRCFNTTAE